MIIVQVAGGLGNQMQQYALYQKFLTLGKETKLDISWFTKEERQEKVSARRKLELDFFLHLPYEACSEPELRETVGNTGVFKKVIGRVFPDTKSIFTESDMYHPEIFSFDQKYLCGYWACEKYYADIMPRLQTLFRFPQSRHPRNMELAARMKSETSVSIHIRRGDYLDAGNAAMFGNICTDSYYEKAVAYMRSNFGHVHFYLFSDDISYASKQFLGEEFTMVDINSGDDSFFDMMLMSSCKHNICANSTFSFWGARLNETPDKVMIRPYKHKNSQIFDPDKMHDWWSGWILIDADGNIV